MGRSVLFINPDYHNSFTLTSELRRRGWRSAVFVPKGYDPRFLYSQDVIHQWSVGNGAGRIAVTVNILVSLVQYVTLCLRFRAHVTYGRMYYPPSYEAELFRLGWCKEDFHLGLSLSRILGVRHLFIPSGCRDEDLKEVFERLKGEPLCGNCGVYESCNDAENRIFLGRAKRYADRVTNWGFHGSTVLNIRPFRY